MRLIEELFNLVAPHQCLSCQKDGSLLCYECRSALPALPPRCYVCGRLSDDFRTCQACRKQTSIHSLWAVTTYDGLAKTLIHRLKFERAAAGAETIATMLADKLPAGNDLVITYVPTANQRVRERGYDQARLVAKALAMRLGLPFTASLARTGQQRQVGAQRALRKKQMVGAFRPLKPSAFQGKQVLLIDDVVTTGATCEAAARTLRQAGAARVSAAVFAVA